MTKGELLALATEKLTVMGLSVLNSEVDYPAGKPDLVAVYPEKKKYYVVELVTPECLISPSPRLNPRLKNGECRTYYKDLYPSESLAAWAAAIYLDLGQGLELFAYKSLKRFIFEKMQRYPALIYPTSLSEEAENALSLFNIQYRSLDILGMFTMTLLASEESKKLEDARKFIQFLVTNR